MTQRTFRCDKCEKEFVLFVSFVLNGTHEAGCHLCPDCTKRLDDIAKEKAK